MARDALIAAPRHSDCNGVCEGCMLYPDCPGDTPLDDCLRCENLEGCETSYYCPCPDISRLTKSCRNFAEKGEGDDVEEN